MLRTHNLLLKQVLLIGIKKWLLKIPQQKKNVCSDTRITMGYVNNGEVRKMY